MLGGGGSTGNAWLIGVIAGLFEAGKDVTEAELTIGTSAGATAAAQLAGASPSDLLQSIVATSPGNSPAVVRPMMRPVNDQLARLHALIASSRSAADYRRRLGAAALDMHAASDGSWQAQWRSTVASRLPAHSWPQRMLRITAVDAASGEPVVFDHTSGVDLVDAVAASCSNGMPYRIADRLCIDGGYRTNADNADLAAGCREVLVLSPLSGASLTPKSWGVHLQTQVDDLRSGGSRVHVIVPHSSDERLFGANAMDLSLRPHAARAGLEQGRAAAQELTDFWQ